MFNQPVTNQVHTALGDIYKPVIKIMGLGGGGSNTINRLVDSGLSGVEFYAANTDIQALNQCLAPNKVQLGPNLTKGLGAGANPKIGESAAEESYRSLLKAFSGADMVFLTAGMGGGTGTGSIAVAARAAREAGAVTAAVVTTPFSFEMGRRQVNARDGLMCLQPHTHTLITVPNDRLLKVAPNSTIDMAFQLADDVIRQGIQGIVEIIAQPGLMNLDFSHIRQVIQNGGGALMSIGFGEGENRALKAVQKALHHPLLEDIDISGATSIIANFTSAEDLPFSEAVEAMNYLQQLTDGNAEIIPGFTCNPSLDYRAQVILVITGLGATSISGFGPSKAAQTPQPAIQSQATPVTRRVIQTSLPVRPASQDRQPAASTRDFGSYPAQEKQVNFASSSQEDSSFLPRDIDLPAFLRNKSR